MLKAPSGDKATLFGQNLLQYTEKLAMYFQSAQSQAFGNYSQKFGNSYWRHDPVYNIFMWKTHTHEQLLRISVHSMRSENSFML